MAVCEHCGKHFYLGVGMYDDGETCCEDCLAEMIRQSEQRQVEERQVEERQVEQRRDGPRSPEREAPSGRKNPGS